MSVDAITTASALGAAPSGQRPADSPEKVRDAARQFEALLLSQMLKSARDAGSGGWLGTGDDPSASSAMEVGEEQFAQALATGGGLGLAQLIVSGLQARTSPATPAPSSKAEAPSGVPGAPSPPPVPKPAGSGG